MGDQCWNLGIVQYFIPTLVTETANQFSGFFQDVKNMNGFTDDSLTIFGNFRTPAVFSFQTYLTTSLSAKSHL
jgi:hypothetical protein